MLDRLTKTVVRFFGIIAGSFSGLGVVLSATGYLAERSHLKMLGFTTIPVDLNQYLYTGALFFAILPGILVLQGVALLYEPATLLLIALVIGARFSLKLDKVNRLWTSARSRLNRYIGSHRSVILVMLLLLQILSLGMLARAVQVDNLLFSTDIAARENTFTFMSADPEKLGQLILQRADTTLQKYFFQLFILALLIALLIRYVALGKREKEESRGVTGSVLLGLNLVLFATQALLLPINYGALLLNKRYQEVEVRFKEVAQMEPAAPTKNTGSAKNRTPVAAHAVRDQILDLGGLAFVYDLDASPMTFSDPDGDHLSYEAVTDAPEVASVTVDGSMLRLRPLSTGRAHITIRASDGSGEMAASAFDVMVVEETRTWGAEVANRLSRKILVAGEESFVRDLRAAPPVFKVWDSDTVDLTFQAVANAPETARASVSGSVLTVEPVTGGSAIVTVTANDGYGGSVSAELEVVVLGSQLVWPQDKRLLVIHQSNDLLYLYSRLERRIWYIRSEDIESMVYYGLTDVFQRADDQIN